MNPIDDEFRLSGTRPTPAPRPDLSAYLAREILALIRERKLRPGDRLPSAKALADHFAVATPTMREALRRLQATGVIDLRHGSGIYVRQNHERLMLANPIHGAIETHTVLQILDARLLIEPHLAALAAECAGETEITDLASLVSQADQVLTRHDDSYYHANNRIHSAIARAAGNVVLAQIVESLTELYSVELHLVDPTRSLEEIRVRDHEWHHAILEAIRCRDAAGAREAMQQHIEAARRSVAARLAGDAPEHAASEAPRAGEAAHLPASSTATAM